MKKKVILFRFLFFVLPVLFIWSCTIIGEPPFVSNDSALDNLTINGLAVYDDKLAFSKTTLSYSLTLYYPTSNITITPRASDEAFATLMVNGVLQFSRVTSGSISLPVGTTNIPIQLVAEDKTTNTYMLSITRKDSNSTPPTIQINTGSMAGDQTIRVKLRVYNIADSESPVTLRIVVNSTNTNDILNAQVAGVYTNFVTVPPGAGNTIAVYAIDADNNSTQAAGSPVTVTTTLNRLNIFSENDSGNDFDWKNDRLDPTAQGDAFQDSWSRSTGGLTSPPSLVTNDLAANFGIANSSDGTTVIKLTYTLADDYFGTGFVSRNPVPPSPAIRLPLDLFGLDGGKIYFSIYSATATTLNLKIEHGQEGEKTTYVKIADHGFNATGSWENDLSVDLSYFTAQGLDLTQITGLFLLSYDPVPSASPPDTIPVYIDNIYWLK